MTGWRRLPIKPISQPLPKNCTHSDSGKRPDLNCPEKPRGFLHRCRHGLPVPSTQSHSGRKSALHPCKLYKPQQPLPIKAKRSSSVCYPKFWIRRENRCTVINRNRWNRLFRQKPPKPCSVICRRLPMTVPVPVPRLKGCLSP